jgi:hypothetical protein
VSIKTAAKIRIAWFTPSLQNDQFCKGAYASSVLLPLLSKNLDIDLFCEEAGILLGGLESKNFLTSNIINQNNPYDYYLYNFENKSFCNFIRIHLGLNPGIVWFHDYNLLDDGPEPILNSPWSRMIGLFEDNSKQELWPKFKDLFIPSRPAAIRESGLSFFSVFSNERDLTQFTNQHSDKLNKIDKGSFLPMPLPAHVFDSGSDTNSKALALYSGVDVDSHIHSVLMALRSFPEIKLNWLIDSKDKNKALELLQEFGLNNFQIFEGRTIETWLTILQQSSICAHLLFSFYDQLQPWLACSMAMSKACLVLNFGETDHLPDNLVFKIESGSQEVPQIKALLHKLSKAELLQPSYTEGKSYVKDKHLAEVIASEFILYLSQIKASYKVLNKKWLQLEQSAKAELITEGLKDIEKESQHYFKDKYKELGWS